MELILRGIGADLADRNYLMTGERYAKALKEMFDPPETEWATFQEDFNDFILLKGHEMWSLCPHHMFPVRFNVSLAYIPNGHVLGLSKLARLLQECNRGPLLQEAFTKQALEKVYEICQGVKGAACLIEGTHGCMTIRGVKSHANLISYKVMGAFSEDENLARRFFDLCRR